MVDDKAIVAEAEVASLVVVAVVVDVVEVAEVVAAGTQPAPVVHERQWWYTDLVWSQTWGWPRRGRRSWSVL